MNVRVIIELNEEKHDTEDVAYNIEKVLDKCMKIINQIKSLIDIHGVEVLTRDDDEFIVRCGLNDVCVVGANYDIDTIDVYIEE